MGSLIFKSPYKELGFPGGSDSKESAHNVGWSLSQGDPLEKEVATYSGILAWRIPWTEEPGRLQSMGLQRVRHNWETNTHTHAVADVSKKSHTTDLFFFFFILFYKFPEWVCQSFSKGHPWVSCQFSGNWKSGRRHESTMGNRGGGNSKSGKMPQAAVKFQCINTHKKWFVFH